MNDAGQSSPGELLAVPPRDESGLGSDDLELDRLMGVYRPYLTGLAEKLVLPPLQGRIDRSDLVQEALVRGFAQRDQFRGTTEAEFSAWLKQILQNVAVDWARHHTASKRDVNRETAEGSEFVSQTETPSQDCSRQEEMARVAVAMSRLSDD